MFRNKSKVQEHQLASDNALEIFNKTLNKLDSAGTSLENDIIATQLVIDDAEAEKLALIEIDKKNRKLTNKIRKFLEE